MTSVLATSARHARRSGEGRRNKLFASLCTSSALFDAHVALTFVTDCDVPHLVASEVTAALSTGSTHNKFELHGKAKQRREDSMERRHAGGGADIAALGARRPCASMKTRMSPKP